MKIVKSSCSSKRKVRTCTFSPQVNIKNKRTAVQTEQDVNAAHSEAKLQDLINDIKSNIYTKVKAVATSPDFGFDENEVDDYFFVEASATEIGEDHHEAIRVEVRGEVSYEGLEDLMEALNPIIESYDSYAYFEPVEPGIIEAYVSVNQIDMSIYGATVSTDHMFYDYHGKRFSVHDNSSEIGEDSIDDVYFLWKGNISQQAGAYNDADEDYVYAFIRGRGVIEYYKKGKYVATDNYTLRDEDDFEYAWEYMEIILQHICDRLIAYNKDVPDRMVYNSTSIQAADDEFHGYADIASDIESALKDGIHQFFQSDKYNWSDDQIQDKTVVDVAWAVLRDDKEVERHSLIIDVYAEANRRIIERLGRFLDQLVLSKYESFDKFVWVDQYSIEGIVYLDIFSEDVNSSTSIESSDSYEYNGANYEFVTNIDGYWVYRAVVDGKGTWRAMPQGSDESEFSRLSFPISYDQARGFEPINEPSAITKLRKDLGKKLLPKAGQSVEAIGMEPGSSDIEMGICSDKGHVTSSTDDKVFIEDIIDGLEDTGYDLNDLSSIKEGLWALFGYQGKDANDVIEDLVAGGFIDSNVLIDSGRKSIYSDTEEDEEDLPMVDQEYDSAATSINSSKLPAIYKMINLEPGGLYVDFGGGRWDNAVEYIKDKGATLVVYDPYNRSAEHNREVLRILRENGGADAAVNSNVLNVIKEPEARKNVLENIARITKPGAPIYITVYEGKGDGQEGPTKSGYQLNRKTADYLEEIQEVFPDATRRGKLITAHNSGVSAATNITNIGAKITCSDEYDTTWIKLAQKQVPDSDGFYTDYTMYISDDGTSYIFMFGDEDMYGPDPQYADYECSDWNEASEWWNGYNGFEDDNSLNDIQSSSSTDVTASTVLDMNPEFRNNFEEAVDFFYEDYPATVELTDEVDEDYDTLYKAYVKETGSLYQQTPGIVYIDINWDSGEILQALQETAEAIGIEQYLDNIESSESVEGDAFSQLEDAYLSPTEYDDPIENEDSEELVEVELNQIITVDVDGDYEWDDDTYVWASPDGSNEEWRSEDGVYIDDKVGVVEHIDDLIIPNVPTRPGKYRVTGLAELIYDVSGIQEYRTEYGPDDYDSDIDIDHAVVSFNFRKSEVQNLKITPVRR